MEIMNNQIIKSRILNYYTIIHGTSTKTLGNMSLARDIDGEALKNLQIFFNKLGIDYENCQIIFPKLKHSANVALVSKGQMSGVVSLEQNSSEILKLKKFSGINPPIDFIADPEEGIDACISNSKNLFIAMLPADCAPVFLFDPITDYYALIHAGVLGAFSKISLNTISCMSEWCSTKPENLICYIGPSISSKQYKLKESGLWNKVLKKRVDEKIAENFNLKYFLKDQLIGAGVKSKNIEICPLCTATNNDLFFSNYVAKSVEEKQLQGRHMSIIGLK